MDLTARLKPLVRTLRRRREDRGRSARQVSADAGFTSTWATELESGNGTVNPTVSRLMIWAQAVGAHEFGVYVVIDGNYTAVPLFGDDED